ncbi:MAG: carboxypeptidase regulatory-like domain-containing protein [Bradyrhizobiaceae bacterium]|nr:carboxypeptidase regulatory-like domain-containing protein [Bradyrhizobiaceae bacterium]
MQYRNTLMTIAALVGLALGASTPAWSGGTPDEVADQSMPSKAIVGFVKDAAGNTVADAKVVVSYKTGNTDLITNSDATGHFRIPGFNKEATADSIELTCSKSGYRQTASLKRRSAVTSTIAPIEIDCVLTHE